MARRKNPAEVGLFGTWAYDTRDRLEWSVEQVIAALPTTYNPATLRKVEGGSSKPGRRMWRELHELYARRAEEKGLRLDPQPALDDEPVASPDLVAAIREQTTAINELVAELRLEREQGRDVASAFDRAATHLLTSLRPVGT